MNARLAKASVAFSWLISYAWNRRGISEVTKIKVYRAVILTTLLYGCETWTTYQWHIKKLNHFHMTCLRKNLSITWQKHIPNTKVLTLASLPGMYTPSWCKHSFVVLIMLSAWKTTTTWRNCSMANCLRASTPMKVRKSASKTRQTKVSMKSFGITPYSLEYLALDRDKWCEVVKRGVKAREARRNTATEQCRKLRKVPATSTLPLQFLVLTVWDTAAQRLASLAICVLTDPVLNHRVIRWSSSTTMNKEDKTW